MSELQNTLDWFKQAIPEPTDMQKVIQLGCHMEEFAEMADSIDAKPLSWEVGHFSSLYKKTHDESVIEGVNKESLLDSLADQIVTAIGVAYMFGLDIESALAEVNRSNFSKFEDGKPVFDVNGKVTKGKNYTPPNLTGMIGK